jgi:acetoacetyl-CoA synthetase
VSAPADILWSPPALPDPASGLGRYLAWLRERHGREFGAYGELQRWSVSDLEGFWGSIWEFFGVRATVAPERVLASARMPGARWFPGARLNYAEHMLGGPQDGGRVAIVAHSQTRATLELTFDELREQVAAARAGLVSLGVGPGDRVVGYLPNIPETLVAFLASASLGATWAACPPEFGPRSVADRFAMLEPKVLFAVAGYRYGERSIDRRAEVAQLRAQLPTLEQLVHVPYAGGEDDALAGALGWERLLGGAAELEFEQVAFEHPLCVLFSSGTTGLPKAIVHGHGGILVEHLKNHGLSWDIRAGDRLMWFTTTAWMMWNALVSTLLLRASIVMLDGNPLHPDLEQQWRLAETLRPTQMGVGPALLMACRKTGVDLRKRDLGSLRQLCAAGSPLPAEGYDWVHQQLGTDVLLNVGSGGTDVCSGIVQGGPWQPVYRGEISGAVLGCDAAAFDPQGHPVVGEVGELVIRAPMPSMPVRFWNDPGDERYRATYFEEFPGVWRHGDWITFSERGSCVISGRSDATLNRGGVRLGTGEFYPVIEGLAEIADSLVVHLEDPDGGPGELILFVVLAEGASLDEELRTRIVGALRGALSPRHVPDTVEAVPAIPRTLTAKKLELPVKRILLGASAQAVASRDALADPHALDAFVAYAERRVGSPARNSSPEPEPPAG